MSYSSKRTIASLVAGGVLIAAYIIYALGDSSPAPGALKGWAAAILIFIGISIGAQIVIQIIFHIVFAIGIGVKEGDCDEDITNRIIKSEFKEDERDKLIGLKSMRAGYIISGAGAIGMLFGLTFSGSVVLSLHIFFGVCAVGGLVEGLTLIYYNERGV